MGNTTENKINYGLKNVHYAKITIDETDGTVTYGKPVKLPGAVNLSMKKLFDRTPIAADDDEEYAVVTENKGYEGDLEILNIPDAFLTDILGMEIDGDTIVESKEDVSEPFALLFEFDGDAKKRRHLLYNCMATNPDIESSTRGEKVEAKTGKMTIKARPAKDTGHIKRTTVSNEGTVYEDWFKAVTLSGGAAE